jgi:hypothetical protein
VGVDAIGYRIYAGGLASKETMVEINVQAWNDPPIVTPLTTCNIVDRHETVIELGAADPTSKAFLGVYIMSLPKKGKLFQHLEDGSKGAEINQAYSAYRQTAPVYQYASSVMNVSSYWGSGPFYSPLQLFGPQQVFAYGGIYVYIYIYICIHTYIYIYIQIFD